MTIMNGNGLWILWSLHVATNQNHGFNPSMESKKVDSFILIHIHIYYINSYSFHILMHSSAIFMCPFQGVSIHHPNRRNRYQKPWTFPRRFPGEDHWCGSCEPRGSILRQHPNLARALHAGNGLGKLATAPDLHGVNGDHPWLVIASAIWCAMCHVTKTIVNHSIKSEWTRITDPQ